MSRLHSILAATDLSPLGHNAVRRAAFLAAEHGAVLHVLHVVPAQSPEATLETARVQLGWLARQLNSREDLVVRAGAGPVLAVRATAARPYRRVMVATSFSPGSQAAARLAADLHPRARLQLAHVLRFSGQDSAMREVGVPLHIVQAYRQREVQGTQARLRRLADRIGIARDRVEHAVSRGPAAPMTLRLIQAWGADLLVAGHSGGSAVRRWLVGDIHRELLRGAQADVLVVPAVPSRPHGAGGRMGLPTPGRV